MKIWWRGRERGKATRNDGGGGGGAKRYDTWGKEQMGDVDGVRVKVWKENKWTEREERNECCMGYHI